MSCGKGGKSMKLCPFSFGLALGLTSALTLILWFAWVMHYGATPMMEQFHMSAPADWSMVWAHALRVLIKGFVFGFVLALLYDLIACCVAKCCKKSGCCCAKEGCKCCEMPKDKECK